MLEYPAGCINLRKPFVHESGYCWTMSLGVSGDDVVDPAGSPLVLYEDGRELGPAHTNHGEIRSFGGGRYSHWSRTLYLSTSDGSDPNKNGRLYSIEYSRDKYFERQAQYAFAIVFFYQTHLGGWDAFRDKVVLELGPGRQLGPALLMASLGARVLCVEKYHRGWDPQWHAPLVERLLRIAREAALPVGDAGLSRSLLLGECDPSAVRIVATSAEDMPFELDGTVDISLSHSVFEHFENAKRAMERLHQLMQPGGVGVHRIDFRDHRDFQNPLAFLLMRQDEFDEVTGAYKYAHGNRLRLSDYQRVLRDVGFTRSEFTIETSADPQYLVSFLPKLRASRSAFSSHSDDDLTVLSGVFALRR
jgi:SAM-dependent methyltransferase